MYNIYNIVSAENARIFYQGFVDRVKSMYKSDKVFDGEFQAYMNVELQNDGPTTLILDTDEYEGAVDFIRKRIEKEEKSKMSLIKQSNIDKHKNDKAIAEKQERLAKQSQ